MGHCGQVGVYVIGPLLVRVKEGADARVGSWILYPSRMQLANSDGHVYTQRDCVAMKQCQQIVSQC